jgi:hypothetical protein
MLTAEAQKLLDFAIGSLPPWFASEGRDMAVEHGIAAMMGMAREQVVYWFRQTLITTSEGPGVGTPDWTQQHAIDRGTRRSEGESTDALKIRIRRFEDAVTRPALLTIAQAILDDAGVAGSVVMLELRQNRAFTHKNAGQFSSGGTFAAGAGTQMIFTPDVPWQGGRPPFRPAPVEPPITYRISFNGAVAPGNDLAVADILGIDGDGVVFDNPAGVAGYDPSVEWTIARASTVDDAEIGFGPPRRDAYYGRGFRMGGSRSGIILMLPFGTSEATRLAVAEAVRQRKGAGFSLSVERRETPP